MSSLFSRLQETLLHFVEFLRLAMSPEHYAAMLPAPEVLRWAMLLQQG